MLPADLFGVIVAVGVNACSLWLGLVGLGDPVSPVRSGPPVVGVVCFI